MGQSKEAPIGCYIILGLALLGSVLFLLRTGEILISLFVFVVLVFLMGFWWEIYEMMGRDYAEDPAWKKVLKATGIFLVALFIVDQGCRILT